MTKFWITKKKAKSCLPFRTVRTTSLKDMSSISVRYGADAESGVILNKKSQEAIEILSWMQQQSTCGLEIHCGRIVVVESSSRDSDSWTAAAG